MIITHKQDSWYVQPDYRNRELLRHPRLLALPGCHTGLHLTLASQGSRRKATSTDISLTYTSLRKYRLEDEMTSVTVSGIEYTTSSIVQIPMLVLL